LNEPGGGCLVEASARGVLGFSIRDVETALQTRCREVSCREGQSAPTGVAGDDVVEIVSVRRM
jgi:hypothetical protein